MFYVYLYMRLLCARQSSAVSAIFMPWGLYLIYVCHNLTGRICPCVYGLSCSAVSVWVFRYDISLYRFKSILPFLELPKPHRIPTISPERYDLRKNISDSPVYSAACFSDTIFGAYLLTSIVLVQSTVIAVLFMGLPRFLF